MWHHPQLMIFQRGKRSGVKESKSLSFPFKNGLKMCMPKFFTLMYMPKFFPIPAMLAEMAM
jgi:hypothetical protein